METDLVGELLPSLERAKELRRLWKVVEAQCAYYRGREDAFAEVLQSLRALPLEARKPVQPVQMHFPF